MGERKPRMLVVDIETLPNLPEALKVWPQLSDFPGRTLKGTISTIICFGYKVVGSDEVKCLNAWDYPEWTRDVNDDRRLVRDIVRILKTADVVIHQNGRSFDMKFIQTRMFKYRMSPLPKILQIDTKVEAKKNFSAFSNSLKHLAEQFTDSEKMENDGWSLWVDVHGRCQLAMAVMTEYCMKDILATEALFLAMKPWIAGLPNMNQFRLEENVCPNCGSLALKKQGPRLLKERRVQRFQCMDCGAWSNTTIKSMIPRSG